MKTPSRIILFFFIFSTCLCACEWGDEVGANLSPIKDVAQQLAVDTFTVKTSTVLVDSLSTTNTARLLAGQYKDPYLGTVKTVSFFQIDLSESFRPATETIYDSLTLSLRYDYHYGDTTQFQQLIIHPLSSRLDADDTYYNASVVDYESQVLGSQTFRARPGTDKRLEIRMSDVLGRNIFQEAKQGNLTTNEEWLTLLKGIALVPGNSDNAAILGFIADSVKVNLYYHATGVNADVQNVKELKLSTRFNQITSDRSQTPLAALQLIREAIPSQNTSQQVYLQGGIGIGVRIDFPTIQTLRNIPNSGINSAILTLKTIPQTVTRTHPLPSPLAVYTCDDQNRLVNYLLPSFTSSGQLTAGYATDPGTGESTYKFDLTEYITTIARSNATQWNGLVILPQQQQSELSRAILGGNKHEQYAMKLEIYYAVFTP